MSDNVENTARSAEGDAPKATTISTLGTVIGALGGVAALLAVIVYFIDPGAVSITIVNLAFATVAGVFYAATNRATLARVVSGRSTALIVLELFIAVGVLIAYAAGNFFAARSKIEWDLTRDSLFTLEQQSIQVTSGLSTGVEIVGFYRPIDKQRTRLKDLVELYQKHTDRITLQLLNPESAPPAVLRKYQMTSNSPRIVVAAGDRQTKVRQVSEEDITNALIQVAQQQQRKVYFLQGHGERSITDTNNSRSYSKAAVDLRDEGYAVEPLTLTNQANVPSDASVVIVADSRRPPLPNEVQALLAWLNRGGRVMAMLEPDQTDHGLDQLFRPWGVIIGDDIVIDPKSFFIQASPLAPIVNRYEVHPITEPLKGYKTIFNRMRSVQPRLGLARVRPTTLIQTSSASWAETDYRTDEVPALGEDDLFGPVPVAQAVSMRTVVAPQKINDEARLVVFGDTSFAENLLNDRSAGGELFVNAVNWLAGDEQKIAIRPRRRSADRLPLTEVQHYALVFLSMNVFPLFIFGIGFSVWAIRRRK